jgi:DNA-binding beta-propeller fold protein YncE
LDRAIELRGVSWLVAAWVVVLAGAVALRLARLDLWALAPAEARMAFDAWLLYEGRPAPAGEAIPVVGPLPLLLDGLAFFLFGVTDATFRLTDALAGLAIVPLLLFLRPVAGRWGVFAMALLAALSPTLVYAARTGDGEILGAALALLLAVVVVRLGLAGTGEGTAGRWAAGAGVALAALWATGAAAPAVALALLFGLATSALLAPEGVVRRGLDRLGEGRLLARFAVGCAAALVVLFSRFFTEPAGLLGIPATFGDWFGLLTGPNPALATAMASLAAPPALVLLAPLLYEPVAVLFAAVGHRLNARNGGDLALPLLFSGWLAAAFLVWGFAAGRGPEHLVHVALPLVLLGGIGLGALLAGIDWGAFWRGRGGLLALLTVGLVVAAVAVLILLHRAGPGGGGVGGPLPAVLAAMAVLVPLAYGVWTLARDERADGRAGQPVRVVLLVVAGFLLAFGLRSATLLAFERAGTGTEMLAQRTPTGAVRPAVERFERLARDVGVNDGSVRDVTGGHSLVIAVDERVEQPWRWYLRRFPEASVLPTAEALASGAEVVISPDAQAVAAAGYVGPETPFLSGVPDAYAEPDLLDLLRRVVLPGDWFDDLRFLLFRDGITVPPAAPVTIGLNPELAARLAPAIAGPFALDERPGPGGAEGQFNNPIGLAAAPDGSILVVDGGNARVQRFDPAGAFLGAWGDGPGGGLGDGFGGIQLAQAASGLGPTGIALDAAGDVFVADTWNHRVLALDPAGNVLFELGGAGAADGDDLGDGTGRLPADLGDDPAAVNDAPGAFFGPRGIAVTENAIFVTDTGNERVQRFDRDGAFVAAFGGFGREPGRLIEPVGIAVGPDGLVYVADSGNQRISAFTPDGEPVRQFVVDAWPAPDPTGARPSFQPYLAFDAAGRLYASSSASGTVEVFAPDGTPLEALFVAGSERFDLPIGVAVSPFGELLVADAGLNAVLFAPLATAPLPGGEGATPAAGATPAGATPAG